MCQTVVTNMLDASFRCDRCSAQAFRMYALLSTERCPDGELFFCVHHANQYHNDLEPLTEYMADESYRLYEGIKDDKHVNQPGMSTS